MSELRKRINADYMTAFKNKDSVAKNLLGLIKSTIDNDEKNKVTITDEVVEKHLSKFEKNLEETLKASKSDELVRELEIVKSYLPKKMDESEVEKIIVDLISKGASNIGMIMGSFKDKPVDKKMVSTLANKLLATSK